MGFQIIKFSGDKAIKQGDITFRGVTMIEEAARLIARSRFLIAFTGAGISAESGIPTFRGKNGLWENYRVEEVATPQAFSRNPELVWKFYRMRMQKMREARPNRAHFVLAELERMGLLKAVITQNIDDLHREAGNTVVELHGNIHRVRCSSCSYVENLKESGRLEEFIEEKALPKCPECGEILRPDVVWFGEPLPESEWRKAVSLAKKADVCLVIGTSAQVFPAAYIPMIVKDEGGRLIEINPENTGITHMADVVLRMSAGDAMERLLEKVKSCLAEKC